MQSPVVRAPTRSDVPGMARVHVAAWQETYRGLMRDEVLDDPGAVARRERMWHLVLEDRGSRSAVAVADGEVVGIALAGPSEADGPGGQALHVLYLLAAHHGSGAGAALLAAVLPDGAPAVLWVADPNPRAQAFYAKQGFRADGGQQVEDGVREIRMRR